MIEIDRQLIAAMHAHAVEGFPEEICGVVFESPSGQVVRRLTNVQNQLHAQDPERYSRDARTAYHLDSRELFEVERQAREPGWRLHVFYHSHPQHGAYFSPTDKGQALYTDPIDGTRSPNYPGAAWMVISVYDRLVRDTKVFLWDDAAQDFLETPFGPRG